MKKTILSVVAIATLTTGAFADVCKDGAKGDYVGNIVCNNLETTDMFKGLTSVKGDLILTGSFKNVDGLSDLKAIYSKKEVGHDWFIGDKDWQGESKFIIYSGSLLNVNGLKNFKQLQGDLVINQSFGVSEEAKKNFTGNKVRNFDSLAGLEKARDVYVAGNLDTNGLYGFRNLSRLLSFNIATDGQPLNKSLYMGPLNGMTNWIGFLDQKRRFEEKIYIERFNQQATGGNKDSIGGIVIGTKQSMINDVDWSDWNNKYYYCRTAEEVRFNIKINIPAACSIIAPK